MTEDFTPGLTPVDEIDGGMWLKRDDLFRIAGVRGGKVRSCWKLCQKATVGLVTASHRPSPQGHIVSSVAKRLGLPCRVHTPKGEYTDQMNFAVANGATIIQHAMGYNNVISKRAIDDAKERGWFYVPFGMECPEAIQSTSEQVRNLPTYARRLVVPVGSAISLSGILCGLDRYKIEFPLPVLGVVVGADRRKKLDQHAPKRWPEMVELVNAGVDYHHRVDASVGGVKLDPIYEAKCARFLKSGDILWLVGIRHYERADVPTNAELEIDEGEDSPLIGRRRKT